MTEFEKLGGTYRQAGNYFLPNLEIDNQSDVQIGIWGQRHRRHLKEHHRVRYYNLLTTGMLNASHRRTKRAALDTQLRHSTSSAPLVATMPTTLPATVASAV